MNDAVKADVSRVAPVPIETAHTTWASVLAESAIGDSLTLGEYADLALAVEEATSPEEVEGVLRRLPPNVAATSWTRPGRWLIAAFGKSYKPRRWRLSERLGIVAVLGAFSADLGTAQPDSVESVITILALFGSAVIFAPPRIPIQLSGSSLFGGAADERTTGPPLPDAPRVRLRVFPIFGHVTVRDRTFEPRMRQITGLSRCSSSQSETRVIARE